MSLREVNGLGLRAGVEPLLLLGHAYRASLATLSPGRLNISVCLIGGVSEGFKRETEAMANGDFTKSNFRLFCSPLASVHTERDPIKTVF